MNGVANVISAVESNGMGSGGMDSSGGAAMDSSGSSSGGYVGGGGYVDGGGQASVDDQPTVATDSGIQTPTNALPNVSDPQGAGDGDGTTAAVTILNPSETGQTVNYVFGSESSALASGGSNVHAQAGQEISFDRGGSYGSVRYTLNAGTYRFTATAQGWDLRSVSQ